LCSIALSQPPSFLLLTLLVDCCLYPGPSIGAVTAVVFVPHAAVVAAVAAAIADAITTTATAGVAIITIAGTAVVAVAIAVTINVTAAIATIAVAITTTVSIAATTIDVITARGSGGKNVIFQMAPIPLQSVLICCTRCQYDILKVSLKKMTRTYPLCVSNIEIFRPNKNPILHAISSHFCIHQRTCIWDFLSMHFSLYTLFNNVGKVSGCDSNIKWSVGAMTGVGSHG
jgi:hypothetical protein